MKTPLIALALTGLIAAGTAHADYSITRETTIGDEYGGQLQAHTQGTLAAEAAERTTLVTFTQFHPHRAEVAVDGQIERDFNRVDEEVSRLFNGSLTITNAASGDEAPKITTVSFTDLEVVRDNEGTRLSGTLQVNDRVIDAQEAPRAVRAILLRLFHFLHY